MGVVYEATDRERNVRVALKSLRSIGGEELLRFKNEFRDFQDLHHPNLVAVGELFGEGGEWFFSMELIDGVSFRRYVRPDPASAFADTRSGGDGLPDAPTVPATPVQLVEHSALDERRLRATLAQLAIGLCALHDAGKIHRDLKPSNVMVTHQGRVVLLDFGLAADLTRRPEAAEALVVGTASYMAPEQAASRRVGPAADWYSVGVMLYEALAGHLPVTGSRLDVMMRKQHLDGASPRSVNPAVPADLDQLCYDLLRFNPAARPSRDAILSSLGVGATAYASASMSSMALSSSLVGRARELDQLREHFDAARTGTRIVALCGESGVGKSMLVRKFTSTLRERARTALVLEGACYERENVPFKGVDSLIDSLSVALRDLPKQQVTDALPRRANLISEVFPVLRRVEAIAEAPRSHLPLLDPRELRTQLFEAVRQLFARLASSRAVVLAIDDLQWADADSLALIRELVRPPDAPCILLIGTVRGDPGGLADEVPGLVWLPLERLPPAEANELARTLMRRANAPTSIDPAHIAREAGGHPLFIDELIRHACAVGPSSQVPPHLEDALHARIRQLEPEARELLELVCTASGRLEQQVAAAAANLGFGEFAKHVAVLRVAHLLRTSGMRTTDHVEPYHGRVRAAVADRIGSHRARQVHRRLALALETSAHPDPDALALHWSEVGDADRAVHFAAIAADKASRALAFDRAVQLYELCLTLQSDATSELRAKYADALAYAGRGGAAGRAYLRAAQQASADAAIELRRRAAEQLLRSGHVDEGLEAIESVLASVGMKLPRTPRAALTSLILRRARVRTRGLGFRERVEGKLSPESLTVIDICSAVSAGLGVVDTIRGADFQARQLLLALQAGEPTRIVRALSMETAYVAIGGSRSARRTAKLLAAAQTVAASSGEPHGIGMVTWAAGMSAFLSGRWREACEHLANAEAIFRDQCRGATWELGTARFIALWAAWYRGDLAQVAQRVPALRRESEERGDLYAVTNLRTAFAPFLALARDDPGVARQQADDALAKWSRQGFHVQHLNALLAQVQADLYEGDPHGARDRLEAADAAVSKSLLLSVQQLRIRRMHLIGCAALACNDAGGARRAVRHLGRERSPWASALALVLRAGLAVRKLSPEAAAARFDAAARALGDADMMLYAAAARLQRDALIRTPSDGGATWMSTRGVATPARLARVLAPAASL